MAGERAWGFICGDFDVAEMMGYFCSDLWHWACDVLAWQQMALGGVGWLGLEFELRQTGCMLYCNSFDLIVENQNIIHTVLLHKDYL